jgi:hypothetical protein
MKSAIAPRGLARIDGAATPSGPFKRASQARHHSLDDQVIGALGLLLCAVGTAVILKCPPLGERPDGPSRHQSTRARHLWEQARREP